MENISEGFHFKMGMSNIRIENQNKSIGAKGISTPLDSREPISEVILAFWKEIQLHTTRLRMNGCCVISAHMRLKVATVPGLKRSCKEGVKHTLF